MLPDCFVDSLWAKYAMSALRPWRFLAYLIASEFSFKHASNQDPFYLERALDLWLDDSTFYALQRFHEFTKHIWSALRGIMVISGFEKVSLGTFTGDSSEAVSDESPVNSINIACLTWRGVDDHFEGSTASFLLLGACNMMIVLPDLNGRDWSSEVGLCWNLDFDLSTIAAVQSSFRNLGSQVFWVLSWLHAGIFWRKMPLAFFF